MHVALRRMLHTLFLSVHKAIVKRVAVSSARAAHRATRESVRVCPAIFNNNHQRVRTRKNVAFISALYYVHPVLLLLDN